MQTMLGPRSVSWQMHADPAMWVAGISSLYLQALHPRAVAGVVQNSNFQTDPLGRLSRTASFVGLAVYGEPDEVTRAAQRVRSVHRTLFATDSATGQRFRVDDPELLLWVHCSEVYSFLTVLRRAGYQLTDAQADRYFDEQRHTAALVGLHADEVPGSRAEMEEYFRDMRPSLRRTEESEIIYRFLLRPPLRGPLRAGLGVYQPLVGHLAYSVLPDWAVELHGHRAYRRVTATTLLRSLRAAALLVPGRVRWSVPEGHINQAVRRHGRTVTPSRSNLP